VCAGVCVSICLWKTKHLSDFLLLKQLYQQSHYILNEVYAVTKYQHLLLIANPLTVLLNLNYLSLSLKA